MKMMCSVVPTFFFLAMALVGSDARRRRIRVSPGGTFRNIILADPPDIFVDDTAKITCDASKVKRSSNKDLVELELRKKSPRSFTPERIATFSYRDSSLGGQLSVVGKYRDYPWNISGHAEGPVGNPTSFSLTAVTKKGQCSDGGIYFCYVISKQNDYEETKYTAFGNVPSLASFDNIEVKGSTIDDKDIFQNAVRPGDKVTLTCYAKGPLATFMGWRKNGKDIRSKGNFEDVLEFHGYPLIIIGWCWKYQHKASIVIKAESGQSYQCQWRYSGPIPRSASINVNINTNGLSTKSDEIRDGFPTLTEQ